MSLQVKRLFEIPKWRLVISPVTRSLLSQILYLTGPLITKDAFVGREEQPLRFKLPSEQSQEYRDS